MDMNSKSEMLVAMLRVVKLNAGLTSHYRELEMYKIYEMESYELDISGLQLFIHEINRSEIKKGNEYDCLVELFDYFHKHKLNSKVIFIIDHYLVNDEFVFHGYHIPEGSTSDEDLNMVLRELRLANARYGELLNLEPNAHPFRGFSLFSQSHFRKALFTLR